MKFFSLEIKSELDTSSNKIPFPTVLRGSLVFTDPTGMTRLPLNQEVLDAILRTTRTLIPDLIGSLPCDIYGGLDAQLNVGVKS